MRRVEMRRVEMRRGGLCRGGRASEWIDDGYGFIGAERPEEFAPPKPLGFGPLDRHADIARSSPRVREMCSERIAGGEQVGGKPPRREPAWEFAVGGLGVGD